MTWGEDRKIVQTMKKIREEVEQSLRRLQVESIDLYQIHWPVPDDEVEEGWTTMAELQREGKVRWIGVSNFSVAQMERALKIAPITSLQPPYSMINRSIEAEILPFCAANGIGVINYSPMQSGLLTGAMTAERIAKMPGRMTSAGIPSSSRSRCFRATWSWWNYCERSGRSTRLNRVLWRLRGRCTNLRSLRRSSADAMRSR